MRAIVRYEYGSPDRFELAELEPPSVVADDGLLVRVRASSVNAHDWHMLRGLPYFARLGEGLRRPERPVLGLDVAGVVEDVGRDVTHVKPGDEVFGARSGAFAEYVSGRSFVAMPTGQTFVQAAAVPVAGCTALQVLRDKAAVKPGQRVLVTGAGGGVGTFVVQIAKAFGAEVTALTSAGKVELVRSLGADRVIDRSTADFSRLGSPHDIIIDSGGYRRLADLRRALAPEGTLVMVAPGSGQWIGPLVQIGAGIVRSRLGRQAFLPFVAKVTREDLLALKELIESGKVTPVVDRVYPLSEVPEAVRLVESGRAGGKVVITV